jgi:hypothetical protein
MMKIKKLFLVTLLTFCLGTTFSQTVDSLSIFPNPFSSATTIHFDIVQSDSITLRVFSTNGQTVRTFFQSTVLPSGSYNINFLGDSLLDGIYIILLEIGSTKTLIKKALKNSSTSAKADSNSADNFLVFPNPTNNLLTIPIDGEKTIVVTDLNGKTIKSITTDQQIISLLDIATGQYFITILNKQNEIITTQKILKRE